MPLMDQLSNYDYELPENLIAGEPLARRDESRLLTLNRRTGEIGHQTVRDLPRLLDPGDCLVLNDTQVIPARLLGRRIATGGRWEGLYLATTETGAWKLIVQTRGKLQVGERLAIVPAQDAACGEELLLTLLDREPGGIWVADVAIRADALKLLQRFGTLPLPPYLHRKLATETDWQRYQTTYARRPGAVAAPTAGLHFTPELLAACRRRGISQAYVTLHVGIGTFRPISVENLSEHHMHAEWCEVPATTSELLKQTREAGGRIIAVGTTTVRTLESAARFGSNCPWSGETDLFIRPPYEFQAVDGLLTNFHLPKSTLLVLISAFAGTELIKKSYAAAIQEKYRFYSYGDAMLIL
jgi:S-adenosylmethionine:tRNA ribosyltransferase-isomerase